MNPLLDKLHPYPFEKLRQLFSGVTPDPAPSHSRGGGGNYKSLFGSCPAAD